ncbi:MAG TPA: hypothetical protein ENK19_06145 [Acidobacteria bacterium]|nr:hypothetical protein [Acidobacteriota bacterium]
MIARTAIFDGIRTALGRSPVVVLTGPRQAGKTTLARELLSEDSPNYFDLEDPLSLARLEEPRTALDPLRGLVLPATCPTDRATPIAHSSLGREGRPNVPCTIGVVRS